MEHLPCRHDYKYPKHHLKGQLTHSLSLPPPKINFQTIAHKIAKQGKYQSLKVIESI